MTQEVTYICGLSMQRWSEYRDLRLQALKTDPDAFDRLYEKEYLLPDSTRKNRLQRNNVIHFFAEYNNMLVGMQRIKIIPQDKRAMLYGVYTLPDRRGKGIATILLKTMIQHIYDYKLATHIYLSVRSTQSIAIHIYTKYGFVYNCTDTVNGRKKYYYILDIQQYYNSALRNL